MLLRSLPFLLLAPAVGWACPQYDTVVAAVQANDRTGAEVLYEEIVFSAACDDAIREWVGDYLARENFLAAREATDPAEQRDLLDRALGLEVHWRTLAELGRLDWAEKDYASAAAHFQRALNELSEGDPDHLAETGEIEEVYDLATAALALAEQPVQMPRTRSGQTGGIFQTSIRGFEVEEVSLPITFLYDSTEFDAAGAEYAKTLADHLRQTAPASIALAGHTDPAGPDDYNLALSEDRAARLKDYLKDAGFTGEVQIAGYGESQLPSPPPGIEPGSDEHHRIARRVAFKTE